MNCDSDIKEEVQKSMEQPWKALNRIDREQKDAARYDHWSNLAQAILVALAMALVSILAAYHTWHHFHAH